jgi:hypothetical protein
MGVVQIAHHRGAPRGRDSFCVSTSVEHRLVQCQLRHQVVQLHIFFFHLFELAELIRFYLLVRLLPPIQLLLRDP